MMQSLTDLANKYGSDKGTQGPTSNWPAHCYTDVYEAYLGHLRKSPISLLEVGMGVSGEAWEAHIVRGRNAEGGASIKMWHEFFATGQIYGADINPAPYLDTTRLTTVVLDQGDRTALKTFASSVPGGFDVIVDDGSHRPDHQQITLSTLFPFLKSNGYYFIEDLGRNGLGDRNRSRYSAKHVLNTRRVLQKFAADGIFETPHALGDTSHLEADIASVAFHVPRVKFGFDRRPSQLRRHPAASLRPMVRYVTHDDAICLLRKCE
jgi:hypothetical protein